MDFAETLRKIAVFLDEHRWRYALVGGLALSAYGGARTTLDLDLAVDGDSQDELIRFMESAGFETLYRSTGYSNHLHPEERWGRVDFIYVRGATRDTLFDSAITKDLSAGRKVLVPKPEHLIAMKVLAMKNDAGRTFQELADIRVLLLYPGVDLEEARRAFESHGLTERFDEFEQTL